MIQIDECVPRVCWGIENVYFQTEQMHQIAGISFPKNFKKVDYKCEKIRKFIVTF